MTVRLADLVRSDKPMSKRQLALVRKWLEEDWESHDVDRDAVKLIRRLVNTVASKPAKRRPKPWNGEK